MKDSTKMADWNLGEKIQKVGNPQIFTQFIFVVVAALSSRFLIWWASTKRALVIISFTFPLTKSCEIWETSHVRSIRRAPHIPALSRQGPRRILFLLYSEKRYGTFTRSSFYDPIKLDTLFQSCRLYIICTYYKRNNMDVWQPIFIIIHVNIQELIIKSIIYICKWRLS